MNTLHPLRLLLVCVLTIIPATSILLSGCASSAHQESTKGYISSSEITLKIKANLLADPDIKSLPISVSTYQGIVSLRGNVSTVQQKQKAGEIASKVKGVESVYNNLKIK
jgi:osmotically-inducible protein OsmY